jgi:quinol-cytochrome oxidoreductase complex cytochrome b subunit
MFAPLREILHLDTIRTTPVRFRLLHFFSAIAVLLLVVEIASGVLLVAYYRPTAADAFSSVAIVTDEVWLGWLIRSLHVWCADFLILFSVLHLIRVFFAHAYEAPRQLTWVTGILLLCVLLTFGFTGTLLPWDQYAYWSTEAARKTIAAVPGLGTVVLNVIWGGWAIGEEVLLRFYVLHIGVLPWIAALLLWLHLLLVWRFGLTEPVLRSRRYGRLPSSFFPDFVLNLLIAVLLLFGILVSIATFFPATLTAPADPIKALGVVRPRWYFMASYELLQRLPGKFATLALLAAFALLILVPVIDGRPDTARWKAIVRWTLGTLVITAVLLLGVSGYRP